MTSKLAAARQFEDEATATEVKFTMQLLEEQQRQQHEAWLQENEALRKKLENAEAHMFDFARLVLYSSDTPDKADFASMIRCQKAEYVRAKQPEDGPE